VAEHRKLWWLVPLVVIAVVAIVLLLLAGMPYGDDGADKAPQARTETIADGTPAPSRPRTDTGTIVDVDADVDVDPDDSRPPAQPAPRPAVRTPARPSGEISESEAVATLRGFLTSRNYYPVGSECVEVRSEGYRNVGYTLEVSDSCNSRELGRWRVDAKTREVFRQREDGRFLRP
jgi:hypothetical protein